MLDALSTTNSTVTKVITATEAAISIFPDLGVASVPFASRLINVADVDAFHALLHVNACF